MAPPRRARLIPLCSMVPPLLLKGAADNHRMAVIAVDRPSLLVEPTPLYAKVHPLIVGDETQLVMAPPVSVP